MGSWEKLGRTVGFLALVATLSAASSCGVGVGPAPVLPMGQVGPLPGPPPPPVEEAKSVGTGSEAAAPSRPQPSATVLTHVVARGETLTSIAQHYGLKVSTIAASPGLLNPNRIFPGQTLTFPSVDGLLYQVRSGDTLAGIARTYQIEVQAIAEANDVADPTELRAGRTLILPGALRPRAVATVASAPSPAASSAGGASSLALAWPVEGPVSSRFGPRWGRVHSGVDIACAYGATIHAAEAGSVAFVGWYGLYGRCVIIDHGGGVKTLYGHASTVLVSAGESVKKGQAVAKVGTSGNSTGPHLHFEVRVDGQARNPLSYLGQ